MSETPTYSGTTIAIASAGTGKTTALMARILAWCLGPGWEKNEAHLSGTNAPADEEVASRVLSRVCAITFTDKAAAQMGEKLAENIADLQAGRQPYGLEDFEGLPTGDDLSRRVQALALCQDQFSALTIHAFCKGVIARHPMEAGLPPGFEVDADESRLTHRVQEVVEEHLRAALESPQDSALLDLLSRELSLEDVLAALARLCTSSLEPRDLDWDPFQRKSLHRIWTSLGRCLADLEDILADRLVGNRLRGAFDAQDSFRGLHEQLQQSEPNLENLKELIRWNDEQSNQKALKRIGDWGRGTFTQNEEACLGQHARALATICPELRRRMTAVQSIDVDLIQVARRALKPMFVDVCEGLRQNGVVTFGDLLYHARALLADRSNGIAAMESSRIDQLLVDEFQDTDELQCSLIAYLALEGPEESRPGLFIVGDPKQSIYGWRNADLQTYSDFLDALRSNCGAREQSLKVNYRSCKPVVDAVNHVFSEVMKPTKGLQPDYMPLVHPSDLASDPCPTDEDQPGVEYWVTWGWDGENEEPITDGKSDALSAMEAAWIARDIVRLRRSGTIQSWDDVMILYRSSTILDSVLNELRKLRIPHRVERDRSYFRRREIVEVVALIRTIIDPGDQLALLTTLRSSWVGIPDAALIPLWGQGFPGKMLHVPDQAVEEQLCGQLAEVAAQIQPTVPGMDRITGWHHSASGFIRLLGRLRRSFREDPSDRFIETLRRELYLEATESSRYPGRYRIANLERFFEDLGATLEEYGWDIPVLLESLRRKVSRQLDAEEARPEASSDGAVRVMTIHKSKGLKAEHVYLMGLHRKAAQSDRRSPGEKTEVSRRTGGLSYQLFGACSPAFGDLGEIRAAVEDAERIRTLYVAMTRAASRLVMCGRWPLQGEKNSPTSYMYLLKQAYSDGPDLEFGVRACAEEGTSRFTQNGVQWCYPALDPVLNQAGVPVEDALRVPQIQEIEAGLADLERRVEAAQTHQSRPMGVSVSKLLPAFEATSEDEAVDRPRSYSGLGSLVGSLVHEFLEEDLVLDQGWQENLPTRARAHLQSRGVPAERLEAVIEDATSILESFRSGDLYGRLKAVSPHVVAREYPVLIEPESTPDGPVGYVTSVLDMVYLDPERQQYVVVDYKTDPYDGSGGSAELLAKYKGQGEAYVSALQEAMSLDYRPSFELWFVRTGHLEITAG